MTKNFLSLILAFLMLAAILANAIACTPAEQGGAGSDTSADTEPEATEPDGTTESENTTDPSDEKESQGGTENESDSESDVDTSVESDTNGESDTEDEIEDEGGEPDISVYKTVSHSAGNTVYPGELITYSFIIKNSGTGRGAIDISDTLPTNTTYVSGADKAGSEDSANTAEVIVAKNRHGSTGNVKMGWIGQFTKFRTLEEDIKA